MYMHHVCIYSIHKADDDKGSQDIIFRIEQQQIQGFSHDAKVFPTKKRWHYLLGFVVACIGSSREMGDDSLF